MQITQPKLKNIFSQQEENNLFVPENSNFLEVHDVSKIVAESIRHSYLVKDVKSSDLQDIAASAQKIVDQDSTVLKSTPVRNTRQFMRKKGTLQLFDSGDVCCSLGLKDTPKSKECELDNGVLTIDKQKGQSLYFNFDCLDLTLKKVSAKRFQLFVPDNDKTFTFEALNEKEAQDWLKKLAWTIDNCFGKAFKLNSIIQIPNFQKYQFIIEEEFVKNCNSGDILLFKDNHTMAKIQRALTFSEYDHVGIVLKNSRQEVIIFQSNSNSGVAFTFWKQLIRYRWYKTIARIAWRRLNIPRTNKQLNIMSQFIVKNLNKAFGLQFDKMFKLVSKIEKTPEEEKARTYFCSELVAAFYKKIGLLEQQKATTQYWPVSFSDARELPLLKGSLEHQRIIVFEDAVLNRKR